MKIQSQTFNLRATVCAVATLLFSTAFAAPGHWYEPGREGHGLQINRDSGFGHAVTWYLYREDGSTAFLIGGSNCESFPCVLTLHEPTARYMGGSLDLGPEVGEIEIGQYDGVTLPVRFDLRAWQPERCDDISPGGVLWRECAGKIDFELLTE
ncbi:MAG: hypothetical protein FKY71_16370 [Spiribacter salinus]|uniref:Uncharacterized protein n=1 Tax=Spiribacter salinus TaxID=1335746 RepID=A0A540VJF5_9GAMM|nr:MAG: hypothetical protein FKY71_16370 [Spiribacter salinus]